MTDEKLPTTEDEPRGRTWLDGVETHIIELSRYDRDDILVDRQYFVLFLDDADDGQFVVSNVSRPVSREEEDL